MTEMIELVKAIGPWAALVIFFIWQTREREMRMGARLDEQQKIIENLFTTTLKDNTTAMNNNTAVLRTNQQAIQELIELRKNETRVLKG